MTKAKIRPTCSFSITCNTFQSSALHTNCTQKTHKTNIVSFKTINFFDGRFWIYVSQKHLKPHKKLLWAKTLHYPIQKAPHSFPNLTFRKWKFAIDLFHTNSPAHGHSSKHEIKVSQTQTLGLPVASVSLATQFNPVPFTQTAQVTQKTHKTNIVSLQIILFLTADSGFTFLTNISNHKKSLWGPKHYNISAKEHLTLSQIWPLQNWIFRRTYFTPTRPRIGFPPNAKFKVPRTRTQTFGLPVASASLATRFSPVPFTQTAQVTQKTHKTNIVSLQIILFLNADSGFTFLGNISNHKKSLWGPKHYNISAKEHLTLSQIWPCKIESLEGHISHQLGRAWVFQQTQNSKYHARARKHLAYLELQHILQQHFSPVPFN